jgi:adenine-specific DNA-methyltransferase
MSAIHDLIAQVNDPRLRHRLATEWANAAKQKKFGLVFEDHLPELLPLHGAKPRKDDLVCRKNGPLKDVWQVKSIHTGIATCIKPSNQANTSDSTRLAAEPELIPLDERLVVREFGEPIFPALVPVNAVANGPADAPWHSLIEADNYHALQLLDYLYAGKVDCIYIDPPYNSGASDWKYNNDYVDSNDSWRHSKWLAFMEKRLKLAKRILNPLNSILIIAIDDNELSTLKLLLDEVFNGFEKQIVNVTINPKGKARDGRLSQVDEYLLIVYLGTGKAGFIGFDLNSSELRWPYLRRSDIESARGTKKGGVRQFYPIYVNQLTEKIDFLGEPLTPDQKLSSAPKKLGCVAVFPIREDGTHMNWGLTASSLGKAIEAGFVRVTKSTNPYQQFNFSYVTQPSIKKIELGEYLITGRRADGTNIVSIPTGRTLRATTSWKKHTYDANAYGSQLISDIVPNQNFSFPKSIYSVFDVLSVFTQSNKGALILDFFAGSGTTLNAVNLLNATDGGQRRCILVTNNEVSAKESENFSAQGLQPGDEKWEAQGICRSVTWPRSKYTIMGKRDDGTVLTGEYLTGKTVERTKPRNFKQIGFVEPSALMTQPKKKQLVALVDGLPQTLVQADSTFIVSENHKASVLFDPAATKYWLEALDGQDHITDFYIVTPDKRVFDQLKTYVVEMLGPVLVPEDEKRLMSQGFAANLAYFKLDFLEKDSIPLRQAFKELLPLLWLKAGAVGPRPSVKRHEHGLYFLANETNNFAVLLDESHLRAMLKHLKGRTGLAHIYIVTDSDEAFKSMAREVHVALSKHSPDLQVAQLYRDYLLNFMINTNQDRAGDSKDARSAF